MSRELDKPSRQQGENYRRLTLKRSFLLISLVALMSVGRTVGTSHSISSSIARISLSSPQRTFRVAVGDVNGDELLDAVFANGGLQFGRERVCLNDGRLVGTACQAVGD